MTSDFKPEIEIWPKLRMRTEKSQRWAKRSIGRLKFSEYMKSELMNLFSLTNLNPEVELLQWYNYNYI